MKAKTTKKQLFLFDKIILGLNIIAAICLLLSYLAPSTDPRDSIIIAQLGFGYLFLVAANLVFVLYWLIRKPLLMLISVLSILVGFSAMQAQYGFRKKTLVGEKSSPDDIRVMQYNVHEFIGVGRYADAPVYKEILEMVNDKQPDIINIDEYGKFLVNRDSITRQLKDVLKTQYVYFQPYKINRTRDSTGNAIFSKYPIVKSGAIVTNVLLNTRAIYADVKIKDKIVRIYCVHLAAVNIKSQSKSRMLKGKVSLGKSSFIQSRLAAAFISRSYQVDQIKRDIENCPYPYIITGDFNDTPQSYAVNELSDGMKNAFVEKGSGFQTTYYAKLPLQIDYIFASKEFDVLNYDVIEKEISDHKPVISDLRLK